MKSIYKKFGVVTIGVDEMSYCIHLIPSFLIEIVKFEPKLDAYLCFDLLFFKYSTYIEINLTRVSSISRALISRLMKPFRKK